MSGSDSPTSFHGQPWSSWIERIGRDKPLSDEETETRPATSVTRLSAEDIDLYGFCPERDTFYGVVCEICNAIVKPQALIRHMESRHPSGTANFPAPTTPMVKPPVKTPFCKVSKLKKSQQSSPSQISSGTKINHTSVKRTAEQANASTSLPVSSSPRSPLDAISVQTTNANSVSSVSGINSGNNSNNSNGGTTGTSSNSTSGCSGGSVGGASGGSSGGGSGGGGCGGGGAGGGGGGGSGSGGGGGGGGGGVGSGGSGVGPTVSSSPVKSPGTSSQPRRKRLKTDRSLLKDREYDPDRHCGVWNEETGKPCTRSLTCKAHTVSLRRTVMGRSKTFDKLLAEHRAAKELPCRTPKITVSVSTVTSANNPASSSVAPNTPTSNTESEAPSSPPVLSLPDTYPLPKTKLEEDFANEELRSLESSLANSAISSSQTISSTSMMTPISVVLPSLSPLPANEGSPLDTATLIPSTVSTTMSIVPTPLPTSCAQSSVVAVFDGETSVDIDPDSIAAMYSPVYNDNCGKSSQLVMQLPRTNNLVQSPTSRNYQVQASSMSSLSIFEPMEQLELQHTSQINGKRLNHATHASQIALQSKRSKHDYQQDYSTAIQVEATTTSTPYPHFGDITWSNCHPEPLAVSRWLRITSSRKQYNFNIH